MSVPSLPGSPSTSRQVLYNNSY